MAINDKDFYASHGLDFDYKNMLDEYIKGVINQTKIEVLTELKEEIEAKSFYDTHILGDYDDEIRVYLVELDDVNEIIEQKINSLQEKQKPENCCDKNCERCVNHKCCDYEGDINEQN